MVHPFFGALFIVGMVILALVVINRYCNTKELKKLTPKEEKEFEIDS